MDHASISDSDDRSQAQARESGLNRLKRQKAEAEQALVEMSQKYKQLESKLDQVLQAQPQQARGDTNSDLTHLQSIAFSNDPEVSEDQARYALHQLMKKELESVKNDILGEVGNTVQQRFTAQAQLSQTEREIINTFGQEALSPDSPQFQLAGQILNSRGVENKLAFYEASHRLGHNTAANEQIEKPPPDEIQSSAGSNSTAEYTAERDAAMQQGDTKGALKAIAGNLFGE